MIVARALVFGLLVGTAAWAADADPATLVERGHYKQARALLDRRLAANPRDVDALVLMARVRLAYSDAEGAKGLLQRAIALQPKNAEAHVFLADAYGRRANDAGIFEKMKIARAVQSEIGEALASDPGNLDALGGSVSYHLQAPAIVGGSVSKARELSARIMALDRVKGNLTEARIASHEKQFDKVEGFYLRAVEAGPASFEALMAAGSYYLGERSRNYSKAADFARQALAVDPGRSGAYLVLVQVYVSQDRWPELEELLARAEKDLPDDLVPYYSTGRILLSLGKDPARAERCFRTYLTQKEPEGQTPPLAGAHWRLGLALERQGKKAQAVQEIQTALQMNPDLKDAQKDLKRLKS